MGSVVPLPNLSDDATRQRLIVAHQKALKAAARAARVHKAKRLAGAILWAILSAWVVLSIVAAITAMAILAAPPYPFPGNP